jgi:ABC-type oligopeptide transport system ATPase subunit
MRREDGSAMPRADGGVIPRENGAPILELDAVTKRFGGGLLRREGRVALDRVSLAVSADRPAIITVAGESGSGKTTLARLALGLLRPTAGDVRYRGAPLATLDGKRRALFRREVQAIFQDPFDVCNPFYTVDHVFDVILRRFRLANSGAEGRRLVATALETVALSPAATLGRYPHELSGGQLQRLLVARAFLVQPRLIVADEPVSMVDASVRLEILATMARLRDAFGISFIYITHDLSTAAQLADEILILHRGSVVEHGPMVEVIERPQHEYTRLLLRSIPQPDPDAAWGTEPVEAARPLAGVAQ